MAVDGYRAVVQWSHEASEHSEFGYRLAFSDGPTVEILDPVYNFTLVDSLTNERTYLVTVTAFQRVQGKEYSATSSEKELRTLSGRESRGPI